MFDKILIRQQKKGYRERPIDVGTLVETMLFYGSTHVIANRAMLDELILHLGADNLIRLMEADILTIAYTEQSTAIMTRTQNGTEFHDAIAYSSPKHTVDLALRNSCLAIIPGQGKARRTARRLEKHITTVDVPKVLTNGAREALLDAEYFPDAARLVLKGLIPNANIQGVEFASRKEPDGIVVATNLNFAAVNEIYHQNVPKSHSSITNGHILDHIQDAEYDLYFASSLSAELATCETSSKLISEKVNLLVSQREQSDHQIQSFQECVVHDCYSIRESFNGGVINANDVTDAILAATEFKGWLAGQDPDANLVSEYVKEIEKKSKFDKLPGKSTRFVIFSGLGLAVDVVATGGLGTAIGLGVSALDTFYLDKLLKGWKPNQFIEEEIKPLLEKPGPK